MRSAVRILGPVLLVVAELWITVSATWMYAASAGRVSAVSDHHDGPGTAIVLGSLVEDGSPGDYVRGRLDAAIELYDNGTVLRIINSGNGSPDAGDEPAVMRAYLQARGVQSADIVDDPEGFDTEASCRRAHEVFGVDEAVLVTQDFHLRRAVALCRSRGVDAVGVIAGCECPVWTLVRNRMREAVLAGPRALLSASTD